VTLRLNRELLGRCPCRSIFYITLWWHLCKLWFWQALVIVTISHSCIRTLSSQLPIFIYVLFMGVGREEVGLTQSTLFYLSQFSHFLHKNKEEAQINYATSKVCRMCHSMFTHHCLIEFCHLPKELSPSCNKRING
jgi:hypothetical protein